MANPMRLNSELVAAAERAALLQKRSTPKQIEFWAELGRAVERVIDIKDILAVMQGLKQIKLETAQSKAVAPDEVFNLLEKRRQEGDMAEAVTSAVVYYEASKTAPGFLDRINAVTGERKIGRFHNGEFEIQE